MPARPPVPSSLPPLRCCSFGRSFLLAHGGAASPRRVRVAMAAALARWPDGVWVRGPGSLSLLVPSSDIGHGPCCGLLVSWGSGRRVG